MAAKNFNAQLAASAVNQLLQLDSAEDQQALLEVINDYFSPPSQDQDDDDVDSEEDVDQAQSRGV